MGFRENVRYYRKATNQSQRDLGERLGVVRATVSQWESGISKPRVELLPALADALGISVARLMSEAPAGLPADGILNDDDEYQLVNLYRQLNGDGQSQLLNVAQGLVASGVFRRQTGDAASIQVA